MPPTASVRLIASDIDGTLLGEGHRVSQRTIDVLTDASDRGVHVVAATGRSHWSAFDVLEGLDCIRWIIGSNGATLYDTQTMSVVRRHLLDPDLTEAMLRSVQDAHPDVAYGWETSEGFWFTEEFLAIRRRHAPDAAPLDQYVAPFDLETPGLVKVMIQHPDLREMEWMDVLKPLLPPELSASTSGAAFIEVTAPEADKGHALAALCAELGVDQDETIAFGDHSNDLGMLSWAGRGYAMENGVDRAKAVTDLRAPHHAEHGVAQIVTQFLDEAGLD